MKQVLGITILLSLVSACSVTGPVDDGFENSQETNDIGRLFKDASIELPTSSAKKEPASGITEDICTDENSLTESDLICEQFHQWRKAKASNSLEYIKFKLWQEFEKKGNR